MLSLRDCAAGVGAAVATDDLETAAAHVAKFRLIEGAARAGGPALEGELEAMRRCTARVEGVVRDRFREACVARDGDAVRRWLPLLKELNLADEAATRRSWTTSARTCARPCPRCSRTPRARRS